MQSIMTGTIPAMSRAILFSLDGEYKIFLRMASDDEILTAYDYAMAHPGAVRAEIRDELLGGRRGYSENSRMKGWAENETPT